MLVRQQKGNNEDMVCKELQTWSAPLSGAQRQGLECSADIVQALNPKGAGNMTEARELPFIISRLESRISCRRIFLNGKPWQRKSDNFSLIVFTKVNLAIA